MTPEELDALRQECLAILEDDEYLQAQHPSVPVYMQAHYADLANDSAARADTARKLLRVLDEVKRMRDNAVSALRQLDPHTADDVADPVAALAVLATWKR
jgi:hypothetical protein